MLAVEQSGVRDGAEPQDAKSQSECAQTPLNIAGLETQSGFDSHA